MKTSRLMLLSLTDQTVISASRFLIAVIIGRFGSDAELGLYSVGFGLVVIAVAIQESLLTTPLTFFLPKMEPQDQRSLAGSTLACVLIYALVVAVWIFIAIAVMWLVQIKASLLPVLLVIGVAIPAWLLREFVRRWLFAHLRISMATCLDGVFCVGTLAGLLLLAQLEAVTAVNALCVSALSGLLVVLTAAFRFQRDIQLQVDRFRSDAHRSLSFGRWTGGASLLGSVSTYVAHWYLLLVLGEGTAGMYAACLTVVLLANPFVLGLSSFLAPRAAQEFADRGQQGLRRLIFRFLAIMVVSLGLFTLVMSLAGDVLMTIVFTEAYGGHQATITALSLGVLGKGISFTAASGLRALNRPRVDWHGAVIGFVVLILLTASIRPTSVFAMAVCSTASIVAMASFRLAVFVYLSRDQPSDAK